MVPGEAPGVVHQVGVGAMEVVGAATVVAGMSFRLSPSMQHVLFVALQSLTRILASAVVLCLLRMPSSALKEHAECYRGN